VVAAAVVVEDALDPAPALASFSGMQNW